jgi:mannose-6-phosphate isomerase-like protein (cupin superfamily)
MDKVTKATKADAAVIEPDATLRILEYPRLSKSLGFAHFEIDGRRPEGVGQAYIERDCTFVLYVLRGSGVMTVDGQEFELGPEDLVTVLPGTSWSLQGSLAYVVATTPPFYPEQVETITRDEDQQPR